MFVHISAGLLSIVFGAIALITKPKGSKWHRAAGRIFLWLFLVLAATAAVLLCFRWNPFFFGLSVLSFYLAFSGWRVLQRERLGLQPGIRPAAIDWIAALITVVNGIGCLIVYGVGGFGAETGQAAVVLGALSFAALAALYDLWRFAFPQVLPKLAPRVVHQAWLLEHLSKLAGAYIALLCAFSGTVIKIIEPTIAQTAPAAIGLPLLLYVTNRYWRKMRAVRAS